jgi:hypothetical protein
MCESAKVPLDLLANRRVLFPRQYPAERWHGPLGCRFPDVRERGRARYAATGNRLLQQPEQGRYRNGGTWAHLTEGASDPFDSQNPVEHHLGKGGGKLCVLWPATLECLQGFSPYASVGTAELRHLVRKWPGVCVLRAHPHRPA